MPGADRWHVVRRAGDRHVTPWYTMIGKRAPRVPYLELEFVRSGDQIVSLKGGVSKWLTPTHLSSGANVACQT